MENNTNSKKEYIEAWNEHINALNILAFCSDKKVHDEIIKHRDELLNLVLKVADLKKFEVV